MSKKSHRYFAMQEYFDKHVGWSYSRGRRVKQRKIPVEALNILKDCAQNEKCAVKFNQSLEMVMVLALKSKNLFREVILLPYNVEVKKNRVLVFARGDKIDEAIAAGALHVGGKEYVEKIASGWCDYDVVVATPDMMKDVASLGAVLGKKGLMPSPKLGTVTFDVGIAVRDFLNGKRSVRSDKTGVLSCKVGRMDMDSGKIEENMRYLYFYLLKKRPLNVKGVFVQDVYLGATMMFSVPVDLKGFHV